MKITVKIGTVEVIVDRPNYKEPETTKGDEYAMNDTILPTLREAAEKAKELYNLQKDEL